MSAAASGRRVCSPDTRYAALRALRTLPSRLASWARHALLGPLFKPWRMSSRNCSSLAARSRSCSSIRRSRHQRSRNGCIHSSLLGQSIERSAACARCTCDERSAKVRICCWIRMVFGHSRRATRNGLESHDQTIRSTPIALRANTPSNDWVTCWPAHRAARNLRRAAQTHVRLDQSFVSRSLAERHGRKHGKCATHKCAFDTHQRYGAPQRRTDQRSGCGPIDAIPRGAAATR
jgi:hypothetical protein